MCWVYLKGRVSYGGWDREEIVIFHPQMAAVVRWGQEEARNWELYAGFSCECTGCCKDWRKEMKQDNNVAMQMGSSEFSQVIAEIQREAKSKCSPCVCGIRGINRYWLSFWERIQVTSICMTLYKHGGSAFFKLSFFSEYFKLRVAATQRKYQV